MIKVRIKNPTFGVPISFLDKYSSDQFVILKCSAYSNEQYDGAGALYVDGQKVYARILVQQK